MSDGELKSRWAAIRAAASANDPLKQYFYSTVIQHASLLRDPDAERFQIVLDARLRDKDATGAWRGYSVDERRLLLRASHALFATQGALASSVTDSAGEPVPLTDVPRDDLVAGYIPSRSVVALIGASGQGKSFLALELAARVAKTPELDEMGFATAERFLDADVRHGTVMYFASEGVSGWRGRARAWMARYGRADHLHLFASVPPLTDLGRALPYMLDAVARIEHFDAPPVALIVIDVLRAAIHGDENSSDVMGAAMTTAGAISRMFNAAVLLVHHAPHSDPERARGSTAFGAAMDWIGAVTKRDDESR